MRIAPFSALHPTPAQATAVGAVPYDTVDAAEAAALAAGNPLSFLHVSRSEIDLPPGADPYGDAVYAQARATFARFQADGTLQRAAEPRLYVYRITKGAHVQTGVVGCVHADDYESGLIKRHEKTRVDKENDRLRHMLELRAHTGPIYLTYRDDAAIDRIVADSATGSPWLSATAEDGSVHELWPAPDTAGIRQAFAAVSTCYIADGHHRAAAAARTAASLRAANPAHHGGEDYNWFMAVLFPASHLRILAYNRLVRDLNGLTPEAFMARLRAAFIVRGDAPPCPLKARRVSMYWQGCWHGLEWATPRAGDPVRRLDVSVLQDQLLGPVLGIDDPRTSARIEFMGGIRGPEGLVRRVDSGAAALAFSMYPPAIADMMNIADANQIMPPKSTWFEPKLRSGLLVHTF